jgi:hypothetical protein
MMSDFEKVYPMFDVDERVKVVVSTGAGKTFCAGVDLDIGSMAARRESWTVGIGMFGICSDEMICGLREFEVVKACLSDLPLSKANDCCAARLCGGSWDDDGFASCNQVRIYKPLETSNIHPESGM